jgi:hypothetical protein
LNWERKMKGLYASFECEVLLSGSSSRLKREDCIHPKYDHVFSDWKMKNKAEAEKTETQLLDTYDYAWNKGNNGDRRHEEVVQKLKLSKKHSGFHQKKTGVKGTFKSFSLEEGSGPSGTYTNWESNEETFFKKPPEVRGKGCQVHKWRTTNASKSSSVFDSSFGNSSYESVSYRSVVEEDYSSICGATSVDGSSCRRPPAEGRKRCWQHTGMWGNVVQEDYSSICGATSVDGSSCRRPPTEGRKRCWQHTGMWGNRTPVPRNRRCDWHKGKRATPY